MDSELRNITLMAVGVRRVVRYSNIEVKKILDMEEYTLGVNYGVAKLIPWDSMAITRECIWI